MARTPAVLDQINLVVLDMLAAVDFYERLGVTIPDTLSEWQHHHRTAEAEGSVALDFDSAAFAPQWMESWPSSSTGVVLGFRVATREDVDELYEELTSVGHTALQAPYDAFWGARYAILEDPSGNAVGLMSPVDVDRRSPPPPPPPGD